MTKLKVNVAWFGLLIAGLTIAILLIGFGQIARFIPDVPAEWIAGVQFGGLATLLIMTAGVGLTGIVSIGGQLAAPEPDKPEPTVPLSAHTDAVRAAAGRPPQTE